MEVACNNYCSGAFGQPFEVAHWVLCQEFEKESAVRVIFKPCP